MANNIISLPYEYFPDPIRGRPVFEGYIYIGEPDLDPVANPKSLTARQENGSEVPLANPFRTGRGGTPVDANGNNVQVLVDGNYSMEVRLRDNNTQVYFVANRFDGEPLVPTTLKSLIWNPFDTLSDALNDADLGEGDYVLAASRSALQDGGGGKWKVVLTSSVTPNALNIVIGVADPTISFVLQLEETMDPRTWGAVFDDATDIGTVLNAMLTAGVTPSIPKNMAVINTTVNILEGSAIIFDGSFIRSTDEDVIMFQASSVNDWSLIGAATLRGTLVDTGTNNEKCINVLGCRRYRIENINCVFSKGHGFFFGSDGSINDRAQKGLINNCAAYECVTGWEFIDNTSSEYIVLTGCNAVQCTTGVNEKAGNTNWNGGDIVDNAIGVIITGAANEAHGIFSGVNINHNTINAQIDDIKFGYTFTGCHWYSNGFGTSKILITNSQGVTIDGGDWDCAVSVEDGAATNNGLNVIRNMTVVSANPFLEGDDIDNLVSYGHFDYTGQAVATLSRALPPIDVSSGIGFQNGWSNSGEGRNDAAYWRSIDGATVHLQGSIDGGSLNVTAFTLPTGYQPAATVEYIVTGRNETAFVLIDSSGNLSVTTGDTQDISLEGLSFRAAD